MHFVATIEGRIEMTTRQFIMAGLVITTLLPAWSVDAEAQVSRIVVQVDGLTCPFCAYSLEKKIKRIDAVADLAIEVDEGLAIITPTEGKRIELDDLPAAVKEAGFTPREIRIEAMGRPENLEGQLFLVAEDGTPLFLLQPNEVAASLASGDEALYRIAGVLVSSDREEPAGDHPVLALTEAAPVAETEEE